MSISKRKFMILRKLGRNFGKLSANISRKVPNIWDGSSLFRERLTAPMEWELRFTLISILSSMGSSKPISSTLQMTNT
jgi:hypothetical protein